MAQYGYGGNNPYDQRGGAQQPQGGYAAQPPYPTSPGFNQGTVGGRDDYGQNVEMDSLTQNGSQYGRQPQDPNRILNECRDIDRGIDDIKASLSNLAALQQRSLDDPDSSANSNTNRQLDAISTETMGMYRNFAGRIKSIKQNPESGSSKNAPQVGKIDRKLKAAIQEYQTMDTTFRKKLQDQMARQYRIVRPEASEAEVREAVEDTSNQQVFSQALLQSDRRGQSRAAFNAVENRHAAIQKIEQQMIELAELFQDMEALVVQQEAAVTNIEMKGEEVVENVDKGTQEIGTAVKSARNARKWKWWCLGISILIIIIIVVIILIVKFVVNSGSSTTTTTKRADVLGLTARSIAAPSQPVRRVVVPDLAWEGDSLKTDTRSLPTPGRRGVKFLA
ncbi:SNARE domain-containing protein [Calycina marina]|uniref:SNARE domain-containing protein n=1 Tax=Calycina marina TaxID=1763456 RepID=A0A9P7Z8Z9_9HELO|nr:SNARE domain-containing protein [Calycina marina]